MCLRLDSAAKMQQLTAIKTVAKNVETFSTRKYNFSPVVGNLQRRTINFSTGNEDINNGVYYARKMIRTTFYNGMVIY